MIASFLFAFVLGFFCGLALVVVIAAALTYAIDTDFRLK